MTDINGRYPLSTGDGQATPLEIIRPEGLTIFQVSYGVAISDHDLVADIDCFSAFSEVPCYIRFAADNASATLPATAIYQADLLFIPANMIILFSPPIDKRNIAILSMRGSGTLILQALQTWNGLALKGQQTRR
jgi:hypothetical protein